MAVAIEIRYPSQSPVGRKSWAETAAHVNVVVQIPDRCLMRAGVVKHVVRLAVAVKVGMRRPMSQPLAEVGPKALPMNVGPDKYQIAVWRLAGS